MEMDVENLMATAEVDASSTKLEPEYRALAPLAEIFRSEVARQLDRLLQDAHVTLGFPIESRVKSWASISEKVERKALELEAVSDLHDLVGFRIVLLFKRDVDVACAAIHENFDVLDSYDTQTRLREDQFGYSSRHFIVRLRQAWLAIPTFSQLGSLKAEVQIRTVAQHIWAAASHKLQYKQEQNVPPPVRRSISRVSALLETVDLELERVLTDREAYRSTLAATSVEEILEDADSVLDVDLLQRLLAAEFPEENKVDDEPYGELLQQLSKAGVRTSHQFRELLSRYKGPVLEDEKSYVSNRRRELEAGERIIGTTEERIRKGVYFSHVGLARGLLNHSFAESLRGAARTRKRK